MPIGRRDLELFELHDANFGPQISAAITCPECDSPQELTFDTEAVREALGLPVGPELVGDATTGPYDPPVVLSMEAYGYAVSFRLPNSLDLAGIRSGPAATAADLGRRVLLERLLLEVVPPADTAGSDLPPEVAAAVGEAMLQADPAADIRVEVSCSDCGSRWEALLDIASFLWRELDAFARRLAVEIHTLASAYGWREADILELSPWRRQIYLDLVAG